MTRVGRECGSRDHEFEEYTVLRTGDGPEVVRGVGLARIGVTVFGL